MTKTFPKNRAILALVGIVILLSMLVLLAGPAMVSSVAGTREQMPKALFLPDWVNPREYSEKPAPKAAEKPTPKAAQCRFNLCLDLGNPDLRAERIDIGTPDLRA